MKIPREYLAAMQSPEFAAILEADPVLADLEQERTTPRDELAALAQVIGGGYECGDLALLPLTPAVWSLWWALGVGFARFAPPTEGDCDIALWTLSRPLRAVIGSAEQIRAQAKGYTVGHIGRWGDAAQMIGQMCCDAFRPLAMLPTGGGEDGGGFGADWLTRICATVAKTMQYPAHLIAVERSLAEVCYYYAWTIAANNPKIDVRRRAPGELCEKVIARTIELAKEYMKNGC